MTASKYFSLHRWKGCIEPGSRHPETPISGLLLITFKVYIPFIDLDYMILKYGFLKKGTHLAIMSDILQMVVQYKLLLVLTSLCVVVGLELFYPFIIAPKIG